MENDMDRNEELGHQPQIEAPTQEDITYEDAKTFIKTNIVHAARSFVAIGFYLKCVRDKELYKEDGHSSVWEFAQVEYGISKSTASRYMTMNDRFSADGNSPYIADPYKDFGKSQLQEMLSLNEEQLEQVTPDMRVGDIRGLARPEEPEEQIPGQMDVMDFPELLPDMQELEADIPPVSFWMEIDDIFPEEEQYEAVATVATAELELVLTGEEDPMQEPEEPEDESLTDLQIARKELVRADNLLRQCLLAIPDEEDIHIRRMKIKAAALESLICGFEAVENPPEEPEQPELPLLRNNDQRGAFVDAYETWPLWIDTKETGERYYRYDLPDGTSMVVKAYHAMLFDWNRAWEDRYTEGYGRQEYYLLEDGKYFRDCTASRPVLIDKLKEIQKKG